jgi:phospholipid-transporting ATPase
LFNIVDTPIFFLLIESEVNLKIKQGLPETAKYTSPQHISQLGGVIKSEQPNNRLYNYDGTFSIPSKELGGKTKDHPVDPNQVLLRGAQLRNTSWIYGVVVFTGHETKLMLNSRYGLHYQTFQKKG